MIIAVHQPNYLPYLGFFDKMEKADIFVIYDNAQFSKEDYHHRNRVRIFNGWKWLTVPVEKKRIPINQIMVVNSSSTKEENKWNHKHLRVISDNYKNAPFYEDYIDAFYKIYEKEYCSLCELNMDLILLLKEAFDIGTEILYTSDLGQLSSSSQGLVEIVQKVDGDTYLSGQGGKNYLDISLFKDKGIKVDFQNYVHPIYKQCYEGFVPYMSAIDALFNTGKLPI
ncbi:WbqC family protein [Methanolobus sp. WCC4]|uniref:WbqC family protein n=1 Tax=Methanolobus sp. WCC4 TaxID=3125784 RepID=UPI0030F6A3CA